MERVLVEEENGTGERLALRFDPPAGEARPLAILYLHGFGSKQSGEKGEFFRARAVADGWPFCSFDFRGHGASEGSMEGLTLSRNLRDVAAARARLEALGHPRLALFGSSMGAATALWHAALEPRGIAAAVHIAPAIGMLRTLETWAGPEGLERWRREGSIVYRNELVDCRLGWEIVEDLRAHPLEELAARCRTPTLLFQGQLDTSVDWRETARFADLAGDAVRLRLFPDGDHRLIDRLDLLWREARAFLLERAAGAAAVRG